MAGPQSLGDGLQAVPIPAAVRRAVHPGAQLSPDEIARLGRLFERRAMELDRRPTALARELASVTAYSVGCALRGQRCSYELAQLLAVALECEAQARTILTGNVDQLVLVDAAGEVWRMERQSAALI